MLEDDESRLQRQMFRIFGVKGARSLLFATSVRIPLKSLFGSVRSAGMYDRRKIKNSVRGTGSVKPRSQEDNSSFHTTIATRELFT